MPSLVQKIKNRNKKIEKQSGVKMKKKPTGAPKSKAKPRGGGGLKDHPGSYQSRKARKKKKK